jgi:branched-subunit amino acid ABC-type transport system permease component
MGKKNRLRQILWGLAIAVIASPLVLLFNHVGIPEFARPAYFVLIVILVAVKVCWELHSRPWFWITIIAIAAVHVPLLMLTAQRLFRTPFSAMLFFGIVDFALILAIIGLIERLIGSKDASVPVASGSPKSHL